MSTKCSRCGKITDAASRTGRICGDCAAAAIDELTGSTAVQGWLTTAIWRFKNLSESLWFRVLFIGVLLGLMFSAYGLLTPARRHEPGILVTAEPRQTVIHNPYPWIKDGHTITPLFRYEISGRVLTRGYFFFSALHSLSPIDLGLGWGKLSDQSIVDLISFVHAPRHLVFAYRAKTGPLSYQEINSHVSNNHLIPANQGVESRLRSIRVGDVVTIRGFLVSVTTPDGAFWGSSVTRTDQGDGACEVIWVDEVTVL